MTKKALVVLSGGQDSTICLFWAKENGYELHAVTFDYDQRHKIELLAAQRVGLLAGVASHTVVTVGPILQGTSPLTDKSRELDTYKDFTTMAAQVGDRVEATFVPMRNALFLVLAANLAVVKGIDTIVTGVCQADNANYPDCRQSFIDATAYAINLALGNDKGEASQNPPLRIVTPLMDLSKAESIALSLQLCGGAAYKALAWSHTAYDGAYPPLGSDHATLLRAEGFRVAGVPDPLVLRAWAEGLMDLPKTENYGLSIADAATACENLPSDPLAR